MLKNIGLIIARRTFVDSTVCISWCRAKFHIFHGPFQGMLLVSNFQVIRPVWSFWTLTFDIGTEIWYHERTGNGLGKIVQLCLRVCFNESTILILFLSFVKHQNLTMPLSFVFQVVLCSICKKAEKFKIHKDLMLT